MANSKYPLSNFPTSVDSITTAMDIISTDLPYIQAYYTALASGNTTAMTDALANIPNADAKLDSAGRFNMLRDAILAIQDYILDDTSGFKGYITTKQTEWQTEVDKLKYIGNYSTNITYYKNNIVSSRLVGETSTDYTTSNLLYICVTSSSSGVKGSSVTDTNNWQPFTISTLGTNFTYIGTWNSTINYVKNNIVSYDGELYWCVVNNIDIAPKTEGEYAWAIFLGRGVSGQLYVQSTTPTSPIANQLWLDTSVSQ